MSSHQRPLPAELVEQSYQSIWRCVAVTIYGQRCARAVGDASVVCTQGHPPATPTIFEGYTVGQLSDVSAGEWW